MILCAQMAVAGMRAAGGAAEMRAHERERELAGEQFVIGEPRPGRALAAAMSAARRPMQRAQRLGEGRKAARAQTRSGPAIPAASGSFSSACDHRAAQRRRAPSPSVSG